MMENKEQLASSFKEAMRRVAATVNVISICVDGKPMGITATAVSVVSMDPPSLLVCVNQAASVHPQIEDVVHFNVNVLHRDQAEVATIFADRKLEAQRFIRGWENDCVTPPRLQERPGLDPLPPDRPSPLRHPFDLHRRGRGGGRSARRSTRSSISTASFGSCGDA